MPQKVNPDVLELVRGKTGRVVGSLQGLLVLIKGLPMAYNRDLQEDKPLLFDAYDTVRTCLEVATPLVERTQLHRDAITSQLERGYLDATTLMEYVIRRGVPQRTAHRMVGSLVRKAMARNIPLAELALAEFQQVYPDLDEAVFDVLGVEQAVKACVSYGSTGPEQVGRQIERWKDKLGVPR
jgi:argininosuccinate lyase